MAKDFRKPKFVIGPALDGKRWSVLCVIGYRRPVEIDTFPSEQAAQYWIDTVSKSWLENRMTPLSKQRG
jgi:hypothetical protein